MMPASEGSQDGLDSAKSKKSVRVSFEDRPQEIGPSTSRNVAFEESGEDDAIMKPRPALPSFGSVRRAQMQAEVAEKVTEMPPARHQTSSDRAIGGILRNSQDPIPPEVTSKESAGYASDESSDTELRMAAGTAALALAQMGGEGQAGSESGAPRIKDFGVSKASGQDGDRSYPANANVPNISLQPPTPGVEDESKRDLGGDEEEKPPAPKYRNSMEAFSVPGGWTEEVDSEDKNVAEQPASVPSKDAESSALERRASAEDSAATQTVTPIQASQQTSAQGLSDISEDSDDGEFSDAVEDPSDLEDNDVGFASLDAIVESPIAARVPAVNQTRSASDAEPPDSPSAKQAAKLAGETKAAQADSNAWGQATAYWSQLSRERREQIERDHVSDEEVRPPPAAVQNVKKTSSGDAGGLAVTSTQKTRTGPATAKQTPSTNDEDVPKPALRKSMRAQPEPTPAPTDSGTHMRKSMRSGAGGGLATSLRDNQSASKRRPQSEYIEPRGTLQKKHIRPASSSGMPPSAAGTALPIYESFSTSPKKDSSSTAVSARNSSQQQDTKPSQSSARIQRELAQGNDSDSESSFRRSRRKRGTSVSTTGSQGRYSMRRSMRAGSVEPSAAPMRPISPEMPRSSQGFSLRSMSPTGSFFGRNGGRTRTQSIDETTMGTVRAPPASRTTMRNQPAPTMRSSATAKPARSKPRYKSRFNDSDDEDEGAQPSRSVFRSRFADSDDEDEPASPAPRRADLAPVRGIPRRQGQEDGDSTDLDEEDEGPRKASMRREKWNVPMVPDSNDIETAMAAARRNLGYSEDLGHEAKEGEALRKGTLRTGATDDNDMSTASPKEKKRGFMGGLLRRNRNSSLSVKSAAPGTPTQVPASPAVPTPSTPQQTTQEGPASPASPSTRGKLVRRSSQQPSMSRTNSGMPNNAASPASTYASPAAAASKNSQNWPLPPPIPSDGPNDTASEAGRPTTSDGFSSEAVKLARTMRPDLAPRSQSGQTFGHRVRIQAGEEGSEPGEREPRAVYSQRTGKKKRFGTLRRAFGIDD